MQTLLPITRIPEITKKVWPVYERFLRGGAEALPLPSPEKVATPIRRKLGLPKPEIRPEKPLTQPEKVAYGAGALTSHVGQFVLAGKIAKATLNVVGKGLAYQKAPKYITDIVRAGEKAGAWKLTAQAAPWLKSATQWGIFALPRLKSPTIAGKIRELSTTMVTGGAFGKIAMVKEMKPVIRYMANIAAPFIIKSTLGGEPGEAKEDAKWYALIGLPFMLGGIKPIKGKPKALALAGEVLPPAVGVPPAPKVPEKVPVAPKLFEEAKIVSPEQAKVAQRKLAEAETVVAEKYKPKEVLPGGALEGTPLGAVAPTPLEEGIAGLISPEEAKEMMKPKAEVAKAGVGDIPKELEPLAVEARKYKSAGEFAEYISKFKAMDNVMEQFRKAEFEGSITDFYTQVTKEVKPLKEIESLKKLREPMQVQLKELKKLRSELRAEGKDVTSVAVKIQELGSKLKGSGFELSALEKKVEKPTPKQIAVEEEKLLTEARGEVEVEKREAPYGKEIQKFKNFLRIAGEKKGKEAGLLFREHIPEGVFGVSSDEVASALGMSENEFMAELVSDITMVSRKPAVIKRARTKIARIKSMAEVLKLDPKFYKILEGVDRELVSGPVVYRKKGKIVKYKKPPKYKKVGAIAVKPTPETLKKIADEKVKAKLRAKKDLFEEWQDSYKSETLSSAQVISKAIPQIKKLTDQAVRDRLDREVARVFAPDYRSPEFVFEHFGLKEKIYTPIKIGQEKVAKELINYTEKSNEWWGKAGKNRKARKESNVRIFRWLDGQEVRLTKSQLEIAKEVKEYLEGWAKRLDLPKDRRIANYITHIFEPDFEGAKRIFPDELAKILDYVTPNKEFNPFLEERMGAKGYTEDVFQALDAYVYRGTRKLHLDKPLNKAASYVDALPLQASRYTDRFLKTFKNRPAEFEKWLDQNLLQGLPPKIRNKLGNRPATKMTRMITTQIYRGTLGFNLGSAMKNLTQFVNTYAELGEKYTAIGYSQLTTRGIQELKDNEVLSDMIIADYKNTSLRSGLKKMDSALFWFFETAEKINRGAAYYGSKQKSLDQGLSEEEAIAEAKRIVRKTQFEYGKLGTPLALQSPIGKLAFTLATYPLKQAEFIGGYAKAKEWRKLARYIISSFILVFTMGDFLGIDYKDVFFKNIMPTLGIVPKAIMDLLGPEWKREKAAKNVLKILTIPGYMAGKKVGAALRGESRTAPSKRYPKGRRRFKIETPKDIIKTLLTGEWSTSGAEKYLIEKGIKGKGFFSDIMYILTGEKQYAPN